MAAVILASPNAIQMTQMSPLRRRMIGGILASDATILVG